MVTNFQIATHVLLPKEFQSVRTAASLCRLSPLRTTMPKDKSGKKEKKEKNVKDLPEADDVEMGDADEPKVGN